MSASKYGWNSIGSTLINQSVLVAGWLLWGSQAGSAAFLSDMWCVIIGDICHTPPTTAPALHCCCSGTQWYPSNEGISSKRNVLTLLAHCWHSSACRQCPSCPLLLLLLLQYTAPFRGPCEHVVFLFQLTICSYLILKSHLLTNVPKFPEFCTSCYTL